jgi:hypothetical protein
MEHSRPLKRSSLLIMEIKIEEVKAKAQKKYLIK